MQNQTLFGDCNCKYCVRLLTLQRSYSLFYQNKCGARFGYYCRIIHTGLDPHNALCFMLLRIMKAQGWIIMPFQLPTVFRLKSP